MIHHGDCLDVMAAMEPESVDAIVTDPPYGLEFMGKGWDGADGFRRSLNAADVGRDNVFGRASARAPEYRATPLYQEWTQRWAEAAYRVAKPSAYLLAFGGTRTVHRMTVALEDAGWIIRDMLVWAYASGFPKSKASLKPAWEPIVMARKPGPLRDLAIDACRIPSNDGFEEAWDKPVSVNAKNIMVGTLSGSTERKTVDISANKPVGGRWPANVILTDPIFDGGVEGVVGGGEAGGGFGVRGRGGEVYGGGNGYTTDMSETGQTVGYGDSGTYSRFFLIPKADRTDREPVLRTDRELPFDDFNKRVGNTIAARRLNSHPTVKPTELMRHLVRLVTPAGGLVLDPFLGSGTTGLACELEGFPWVGIEREAEYVAIAEARLNGTQRGLGLTG